MTPTSRRPYFLELLRIRFPVGAVCSIGHRLAGVILAVALPALVYLPDRSLAGPQQYAAVVAWLRSVPGKVMVQAMRFIADSRDRATAARLTFLDDAYRLFRCRSIMNCTEVCPKGLNPNRAIDRIRMLMLKREI